MAHRIADTESNIKEIQQDLLYAGHNKSLSWVKHNIIDHPFNVVLSCSTHNSYFNIGFKKKEKRKLLDTVYKDLSL